MAMEHKAYAFDWSGFESDLQQLLVKALVDNSTDLLETYINRHWQELKDPYEGEPLPPHWRESLEDWNLQVLGDYALTRFYDPAFCEGVGYEWIHLIDKLPGPSALAMLGFSVGPPEQLFDPGGYGSYFQVPNQVSQSLAILKNSEEAALAKFVALLELCELKGLGVYITF